MEDLVIGKGSLAGKGVYAGRNFKQGEVVVPYHLTPITQEEFDQLPDDEKEFTHKQHGQIHLYGKPERYVNHSDDPNTYQDFDRPADVALRNTAQGEAITTDASKDDVE